MTVLLFAIGNEIYDICKYLLDKGFDVNLHNRNSEIALNYAVHRGNEEIVDLLLLYSPNLNLRSLKDNGLQNTPNTNAIETAVYRNKKNIVEKLIAVGCKFSLNSYKKSCNINII